MRQTKSFKLSRLSYSKIRKSIQRQWAHFSFKLANAEIYQLINSIHQHRLSYCGIPQMITLSRMIQRVQSKSIQGRYVEAGCAMGGSAILISRLKPQQTPFAIYDVFSQIPPPGEKDQEDAIKRFAVIQSGKAIGLGESVYYGYRPDLRAEVIQNMASFDVRVERDCIQFVEGLFSETMHIQDPVAFAHIDCDWYDSIQVCLERITPHLVVGGIIVVDDYGSYKSAKKCLKMFIKQHPIFKILHIEGSISIERVI